MVCSRGRFEKEFGQYLMKVGMEDGDQLARIVIEEMPIGTRRGFQKVFQRIGKDRKKFNVLYLNLLVFLGIGPWMES